MILLTAVGLVSCLLAWSLAPLTVRLAHKVGAMDFPGGRKIHRVPTPRLGGLAVFMPGALCLLGLLVARPIVHHQYEFAGRLWPALLLGATLIYALGLYDDLVTLGVGSKMLVQTVAAAIVIVFGGFRVFGPSGMPIASSGWVAIILSFLWVVGVTNAFNLIDGLDGLAAGMGILAAGFALVALTIGKTQDLPASLALAASGGLLLGFLPRNLHPAREFLGNNGSLTVGYILSVLVLGSRPVSGTRWMLTALVVAVPLFDTAMCVIRRLWVRVAAERRLQPSALFSVVISDRAHIHHRLLDAGIPHGRAVLLLDGLALFCGLLFLSALLAGGVPALVTAWLLAGIAFLLLWCLPHFPPWRGAAARSTFRHSSGQRETGIIRCSRCSYQSNRQPL